MSRILTAFVVTALAVALTAARTEGQEPVAPRDTAAAADTAAAVADTLVAAAADTTLEEIEARLLGELGAVDSIAPAAQRPVQGGGVQSLNPDISLISDFLLDLSPDEATLENGERYQLRELEIGVQGVVDPYFRYDAFLGLHGDGIEVEEAYVTTLALPARLQARLGKFLVPFGKVNLTHRPELPMFDYPLVHRDFFGEEGFSSTGVWGSWIGAPLGFYQELSIVGAEGIEAHGHEEEEITEEEAHASSLAQEDEGEAHGESLGDDLGDRLWLAHFKNSLDPTPASNFELGASWATAIVEEEEVRARTNFFGIDVTYRWKPPQFAKYRSAILQVEAIWRDEAGIGETKVGGFAFAQWQLGRRWFVGARGDWVEPPEEDGTLKGGQLLVKWFPTEFSQLRLAYERQDPEEGDALDRLVFQTTFALGPHRPHAF